MIRRGTRVRIVTLWDAEAMPECVNVGDQGVVTDYDPHRVAGSARNIDAFYVSLDNEPGEIVLVRGEIERIG